jgi:predicted GNAT family acetyltransferase
MSLENMTIVVGAGTGDVGVGIVDALADHGARVLVPTRSKEKGQLLLESVARPDRVSLLPATPTDDASTVRLVEALGSVGQIDGAIASLGSWFSFGRLVDTPADGFETAWRSLLFADTTYRAERMPRMGEGRWSCRRRALSGAVNVGQSHLGLGSLEQGEGQSKIDRQETGSKGSYTYASEGGPIAEMTYSIAGEALIIIDHTDVPSAYRGQGVGAALVSRAVEDMRAAGKKIVPLCPFAAAQFRRQPRLQILR